MSEKQTAISTPATADVTPPAATSAIPTKGIDWPNLMLMSDHQQADARGRSHHPREWRFRIELDTPLKDAQPAVLHGLLEGKDFRLAGEYLKSVRRKLGKLTPDVERLIDATFGDDNLQRPSSVQSSRHHRTVLVQVVEDFAPSGATAARVQLDVPLDEKRVSAEEMRDKIDQAPNDARSDLDEFLGKIKRRPRHVVAAALTDHHMTDDVDDASAQQHLGVTGA